jgi:hypothetical protein
MLTLKKRPARPEQSQSLSKPPTPEQRAEGIGASENAIRPLAYRKWQEAGCPSGDGVTFWLAAEAEIQPKRPR